MTTTVNVSAKRQVELPEAFCKRKKIKSGTAVRVTEVGEGLYVAPISEPTEKEFKQVIAAAGSLLRHQSGEEEDRVRNLVREYRKEERHSWVWRDAPR